MRKVVAAMLSVMALFSLSACHHDDHSHEHQTAAHDHHTQVADPTLSLTLDGDKKWLMDEHTRRVVNTMLDRIKLSKLAEPNEASRLQLGKELKDDIQDLIRGCTMTGAAHDELHRFLAAYIPQVEALNEKGELEHFHKVVELIESYTDYFE